jgi:tRNA-splicing endonuclease subunit Sen34
MSSEAIRKRKEREDSRRRAASARAAKDAADAHEADVEDEDGDGDGEDGAGDSGEGGEDTGTATTSMVSSVSTVTPSKAASTKPSSFLPLSTTLNPNIPYTISIPASSSSLEWYQAFTIFTTLSSAREAGVWTYPSTLSERARCGVFQDLWKQGNFIGGGIKFGGEYLIYPGKKKKSTTYIFSNRN